jgi:lipid II:glycine glycyltransferase (peptidoglycan interpeptide bridge formation enzyme)
MEIREIEDKKNWENFISECEEKTFLQSWNWGEFNKMEGNKIRRWGIYDNDNLVATAFFYKIQAKRGIFMFVPHGPVFGYQVSSIKYQVLEKLIQELKQVAKKEGASFIRIGPILGRNEENNKIFKDLGLREAPIHIHPDLTWELDITSPEEEILAGMKKTTRYLIRQAQKNPEIKIIQSPAFAEASAGKQGLDYIEEFDKLNKQTVDRHHFTPFSSGYLKNEFLAFSQDNEISIFLGKYRDEIVSSGIFVFWQGIAFYHHGASSLKYPKIPVSYLLLWEAILEAKKRGCKKFNFWGISPESDKTHPWSGLSLFKMGFGGYQTEYVKTQDFPISKRYYLTYFFEKIRRISRGL